MVSLLVGLFNLILILDECSSQYPFTLDIPSDTKCIQCDFNWPTASHFGYSFIIDTNNTSSNTIDLDSSNLVSFSSITINYNSFNSTDPSCTDSNFLESYNYQISIYYHDGVSWTTKGTKSGIINRENTRLDRISLSDIPTITLNSGQWYVGIRLSWQRLSQQCHC